MTDSPDRTPAPARTAAQAIRSLNHATPGGDGPGQPAGAYAVLARDPGQTQQQLASVNARKEARS